VEKRKILLITDSPALKTGYGGICRNLAEALIKNDFEVAVHAWYYGDTGQRFPYPIYTTVKSHGRCCKSGGYIHKVLPDGKIEYYILNNSRQYMFRFRNDLPCNTTGNDPVQEDRFGLWSSQAVINDFRPDIVWVMGDLWMTYHLTKKWRDMRDQHTNRIRDSYRLISYTPIDGDPMPREIDFEGVKVNWPNVLADADAAVAFCKYGKDTMNKQSGQSIGKEVCSNVIHHGFNTNVFKPMDAEARKRARLFRFNIKNEFLVGFVSRNQPRKAIPELFATIAEFKKQGLERDRKIMLYMHMKKEDQGWNIHGLINQYGAQDWVILNDQLGIGIGPPEEELAEIMNCFDCHMLLSSGEGWAMTMEETLACGIPTIAVDYSAQADWGRIDGKEGLIFVKPSAYTQEPITNIGRAHVKVDDVLPVLKEVYEGNKSVQEHIDVGLEIAERDSWKNIAPQWLNIFKTLDIARNVPYQDPADNESLLYLEDILNPKDKMRILVTMPEAAGDVHLTTGVLRALKKKYPFASIYMACNRQFYPILEGIKEISKVIPYDDFLMDYNRMDEHFALVYTPHFYTQRYANWVHSGMGKHLLDLYAWHCDVEPEEPYIPLKPFTKEQLPYAYITFNCAKNEGPWKARYYPHWQEVIDGIDMTFVQVGIPTDSLLRNVIDLRGKTSPQELASIIKGAALHVGMDSFAAHISSTVGTQSVITFPNTYPHLTGPRHGCHPVVPSRRWGECTRPCHMYECKFNEKESCVTLIEPSEIINKIGEILGFKFVKQQTQETVDVTKEQ